MVVTFDKKIMKISYWHFRNFNQNLIFVVRKSDDDVVVNDDADSAFTTTSLHKGLQNARVMRRKFVELNYLKKVIKRLSQQIIIVGIASKLIAKKLITLDVTILPVKLFVNDDDD